MHASSMLIGRGSPRASSRGTTPLDFVLQGRASKRAVNFVRLPAFLPAGRASRVRSSTGSAMPVDLCCDSRRPNRDAEEFRLPLAIDAAHDAVLLHHGDELSTDNLVR